MALLLFDSFLGWSGSRWCSVSVAALCWQRGFWPGRAWQPCLPGQRVSAAQGVAPSRPADSRIVNLKEELSSTPIASRQIDGIFTSPPYVGQIDYHDQHIYAYELFGYPRQDELEIGPKKKGKSKQAQKEYVEGITAVLRNIQPLIKPDGKIFIVANDRFHLYPEIARLSGLRIVDEFYRAVTKRTEQGDDPYQETIFFMMKDI